MAVAGPGTTDVLIVGGGPTGLAASILLSRQGVDSLLVERRKQTSTMPRARGVHRRTMEIFRVCGLADAVYAAQYPLRPERVWSATLSAPIERREPITAGELDDNLSPAQICGCAQDVLEPLMLAFARANDGADVRFGVRLESLEQEHGGVLATIADAESGERGEVHARYVIAADGPASGLRDSCEVAMDGHDHLSDKLNILFRGDVRRWVDDPPPLLHIVEGPVKGTFVANGPGGRFQFDVDLEPGMWGARSGLDDAARFVRDGVGDDDFDFEVLGALRWRTAAQVAERYRAGSVFFAGDAAHRLTPMGGMGISTGIHDVHNLAWKLAMVLHGRAGDGLLDTYEAERRPVGLFNVGFSLRMLRREESGNRLTDADLGQVYASAAILPEPGQAGAGDPTGLQDVRPGARAPHVWIDGDSGQVSTIDLFEREFVLLAPPAGREFLESAAAAAAGRGILLATRVITEPSWAAPVGLAADGALLVRPDGVIAWRASEGASLESESELLDGLEAALGTADRTV